MAIDYNKVTTTFNGLSFIGAYSQRPICGTLAGHDKNTLSVAKLAPTQATTKLLPASPLSVTASVGTNAGKGLNPNVLTAKELGTTLGGFLLVNEKDVLEHGEVAAYARNGQLVKIALIGSQAEIYLPADSTLTNVEVGAVLNWDTTNKYVTTNTGTEIKGAVLLSSVVDGIKFVESATGDVKYEACKCVKIRLS